VSFLATNYSPWGFKAKGRLQMSRKAFTLIELLVVIAIIAILAAILFPVFAQAREAAKKSSCMVQQREVGLGLLMYLQDYDEVTVPWSISTEGDPSGNPPAQPHDNENFAMTWDRLIQPYLKNGELTLCPSDQTYYSQDSVKGSKDTAIGGGQGNRSYAIVSNMAGGWCPWTPPRALGAVANAASTIYLTERDNCASSKSQFGAGDTFIDPHAIWNECASTDQESDGAWRHNDTANFLFADGHVKAFKYVVSPNATFSSRQGRSVGDAAIADDPGVLRFPGYDYKTDGSLWSAKHPVPDGGALTTEQCGL